MLFDMATSVVGTWYIRLSQDGLAKVQTHDHSDEDVV